jgi:hypothetical protein
MKMDEREIPEDALAYYRSVEAEVQSEIEKSSEVKLVTFLSGSKGKGRLRKHPVEIQLVSYGGFTHLEKNTRWDVLAMEVSDDNSFETEQQLRNSVMDIRKQFNRRLNNG